MRSVILSLKKVRRRRFAVRLSLADLRHFFIRYGIKVVFACLILAGLIFGSICAKNADLELLNSLDFLFTTNIDARLQENAFGIFSACFASNFLFILIIFLLGLAPWGIPIMPFIIFFKGFGIGITAGYLLITYSLTGAGFYLLVILPGTFLFCMTLIQFAAISYEFSKQMFLSTIRKTYQAKSVGSSLSEFCSKSVPCLVFTFISAILDTALWMLFSGAFDFK